ncbi:uncharacterized protein [Lepisosteus oculatus]|uniref:uncharacterized protein n=1 Tax=Lepisosteus oculatus TaxID=7918 RepID=UPI0035F50BD3
MAAPKVQLSSSTPASDKRATQKSTTTAKMGIPGSATSRGTTDAARPADRSSSARTSQAQRGARGPARGQVARSTETRGSGKGPLGKDAGESPKKSASKTAVPTSNGARSAAAQGDSTEQVPRKSANPKTPPIPTHTGSSSSPPSGPPPDQALADKMGQLKVACVEEETRGQRENPLWFQWRQNRITASVTHRIANCRFVNGRSSEPPRSYLQMVTGSGSGVRTRAMSWGIEKERIAVETYRKKKSRALGREVSVRDCGLFIDPYRTWLAASPDGIVLDSETGEELACLEVKCPYKHRDHTASQACQDPDFCLRQDGEGYRLKTNHSYYTQVQCQMAVVGLHTADFVVYTPRETVIVPVEFDPVFWRETVAKLEMFYTDAVIPQLQKNELLVAVREE